MARLTLDIGPYSMLWPIIISGMGTGMVFVPLATISMGTLKNEQIGNASGLFNLMRNVGGGIGISLVNTLVARHAQIHRAELAQNLAPQNPAFQQTFNPTRGLMSQYRGAEAFGSAGLRADPGNARSAIGRIFLCGCVPLPCSGLFHVRWRGDFDEARQAEEGCSGDGALASLAALMAWPTWR